MAETAPPQASIIHQSALAIQNYSSGASGEDLTCSALVQSVACQDLANNRSGSFSLIARRQSGLSQRPKPMRTAATAVVQDGWARARPLRGDRTQRPTVGRSPEPLDTWPHHNGMGDLARRALRRQRIKMGDTSLPPNLAVPHDAAESKRSPESPHEALDRDLSSHPEGIVDRITVLIADSDGLVRQGLRLFLALQEDVQVIGEAASNSQALSLAEAFHPDILLLSVEMLKASGLEFLFDLRAKSPRTKALIFSSAIEDTFIIEALQHGAMGYLLKTATQHDLIKAIRVARAGEVWAQRRVLTEVIERMRSRLSELERHPVGPGELLTDREREIVQSVIQGMTNKEIAIRLRISEKTVKSHLHSIFGKLKVSRRVQLCRLPDDISSN
jgi:DNA-binding NarL/FixJ family response regulator